MDPKLFDELTQSIREAGTIMRGEAEGRRMTMDKNEFSDLLDEFQAEVRKASVSTHDEFMQHAEAAMQIKKRLIAEIERLRAELAQANARIDTHTDSGDTSIGERGGRYGLAG